MSTNIFGLTDLKIIRYAKKMTEKVINSSTVHTMRIKPYTRIRQKGAEYHQNYFYARIDFTIETLMQAIHQSKTIEILLDNL